MKENFDNGDGLVLTVTDEEPTGYEVIMGGDDLNPTWEEYISGIDAIHEIRIELIRTALEEMDLIGEKACSFADDLYFVFSDGHALAFTWRAWGDLMQAIVGKREGYMKYYC